MTENQTPRRRNLLKGAAIAAGAISAPMIATAVKEFPNFKVAATTLRNAKTASVNDWSAILYAGGQFYASMMRENLEIYDRVGGGDGFASGLAYRILESGYRLQIPRMFAALVLLSLAGIAINAALATLGRLLLRNTVHSSIISGRRIFVLKKSARVGASIN